jgi:hypothetical protein
VDVHELDADRPAVDPVPTLRAFLAGILQVGVDERLQSSQRVEVRLEVTPSAESVARRSFENMAVSSGATF